MAPANNWTPQRCPRTQCCNGWGCSSKRALFPVKINSSWFMANSSFLGWNTLEPLKDGADEIVGDDEETCCLTKEEDTGIT
jgi:hypothetical protein